MHSKFKEIFNFTSSKRKKYVCSALLYFTAIFCLLPHVNILQLLCTGYIYKNVLITMYRYPGIHSSSIISREKGKMGVMWCTTPMDWWNSSCKGYKEVSNGNVFLDTQRIQCFQGNLSTTQVVFSDVVISWG